MFHQFFIQKRVILIFLAFAALVGCRKDEYTFAAYEPTTASLTTFLQNVPIFQKKSLFEFKGAVADTILTTPEGYDVYLTNTDSLFADETGTLVPCSSCLALKIHLESATKSGDLIAKGLSTLDADGRLLESGGTIKFNADCQGKLLNLYKGRTLKVSGPGVVSSNKFFLFEADDFTNALFKGWSGTGQEAIPVQSSSTTIFDADLKQPGWLNFGQYIQGNARTCYALLPAEYSGDNTRVFFVLKNKIAVAPLTYIADKHFFRLDVATTSEPAQLVSISKMNDGWRFSRKDIDLNLQSSFSLFPKTLTEQQFIEQLDAL